MDEGRGTGDGGRKTGDEGQDPGASASWPGGGVGRSLVRAFRQQVPAPRHSPWLDGRVSFLPPTSGRLG